MAKSQHERSGLTLPSNYSEENSIPHLQTDNSLERLHTDNPLLLDKFQTEESANNLHEEMGHIFEANDQEDQTMLLTDLYEFKRKQKILKSTY